MIHDALGNIVMEIAMIGVPNKIDMIIIVRKIIIIMVYMLMKK